MCYPAHKIARRFCSRKNMFHYFTKLPCTDSHLCHSSPRNFGSQNGKYSFGSPVCIDNRNSTPSNRVANCSHDIFFVFY